ncbi:MAG: citrate/2-methylcitrate synthase [Thermoplasmatales archaeon]
MTEKPIINYGLEGVYVDESSISLVDGLNGKLWYRGYSIEDLADITPHGLFLTHPSLPDLEHSPSARIG